MADVLLIFVREDLDAAEALAFACEQAGFEVHPGAPHAAESGGYRSALILWSGAAQHSEAFLDAAYHAAAAGKALIANLDALKLQDVLVGAPEFALMDWDGEAEAPELAPLMEAIRRRVRFAGMMDNLKTFAATQSETREPEPAIIAAPAPPAARTTVVFAPPQAEPVMAVAPEPELAPL